MTVIYPNENYEDDIPGTYDIESEKERIAKGTEKLKKDLLAEWNMMYSGQQVFPDALQKVSPGVIDFMLSVNVSHAYGKLADEYNLNQAQRNILPQIAWKTVIENEWRNGTELVQKALKLDHSLSDRIAKSLYVEVLEKAKRASSKSPYKSLVKKREETRDIIVSMPISQALKKYPKLNEQLITDSPIKLENFPAMARPSIKNWIIDYHQSAGAQKHGTLERGKYIFHNKNAKRMSDKQKQKIAYVLKSLDEGMPLKINTTREQIIFPEKKKEGYKTANTENIGKKQSIHFSSSHRFPVERTKTANNFSFGKKNAKMDKSVVDLKSLK